LVQIVGDDGFLMNAPAAEIHSVAH
jgi:hypothetical protein